MSTAPSVVGASAAELRTAERLRRAGKLDKALAHLRSLVASVPNDVDVRGKLAQLSVEAGNRDAAISEYVKIQEQLADSGDVLGAISAGLKVVELDPKFDNPLAFIAKIKIDSLRQQHEQDRAETSAPRPVTPLAEIPLLSGLASDELQSVAAGMKRHELDEGSVVFREGDRGDSVYFVHEGALTANRSGASLGALTAGHCFGEFSFLTQKPRIATVKAVSRAEVLELSAEKMRGVVASHPRVRDVLFEMFRERALANVLSQSPLFEMIPAEERSRLARRFELVRLAKDQCAIREGESDGTIYLIKEGSVSVRAKISGEMMKLATLGQHQFFGEVSFLTKVPRTASVCAVEDSELLQIDAGVLRPLLESYPAMEAVLRKHHLERVTATADALKAFLRAGRIEGLVS